MNGVIGYIVLVTLIAALGTWGQDGGIEFVLICLGCAMVWQGVGIWRSASQHRENGGWIGWSLLAKVAVCAVALLTARDLWQLGGLRF